MNSDDIASIEAALGITLPGLYRDVLSRELPPDLSASARAGDAIVWSDPANLVEWNLKYRSGYAGAPPWPLHLYMVGDDGAASPYVIDLRNPQCPVFLVDHGNPLQLRPEAPDIASWLSAHINDVDTESPAGAGKGCLVVLALLGSSVLTTLLLASGQ